MKKQNQQIFWKKPALTVTYDKVKNRIAVPSVAGYQIQLHGVDYQQIVNTDLQVHQPLSAKTVHLSFKLTEEATGKTGVSVDYPVHIPGLYTDSKNKPAVIPELAEWKNSTGRFTTKKQSRVVIHPYFKESLAFAATAFCKDYQAVTGNSIPIDYGEEIKSGDFYFTLKQEDSFLGEEGYHMTIGDSLCVSATHPTGLYWGTRTILQILRQSSDHSLPQGSIRDYPKYPVRGFMLDVARRPMSLAMLRQFVQNMAWYKMNDLQIHLNDNHIWLEEYNSRGNDTEAFSAYEAFRLESGLQNEKGERPTASDYSYSKADFQDFIEESRRYGVQIVPEIDVPAHALSFTKTFPEHMVRGKVSPLMKKRPLSDHLDISSPETMAFVKTIFDDYTKGENPVFDKNTVVHIGADEFLSDYRAYRQFFNEIVPYIGQTNPVRIWGGLTWIKDTPLTQIVPEAIHGVQMNLWSKDWADGLEMYQMGFQLINTIDQYVYMVPNGTGRKGSYQDYLNKKALYKHFTPHQVRTKNGSYATLPMGDPRLLGGVYALWNDNIDKHANGLTETDLFERFFDSLPLLSEKTWANGKEKGSVSAIDNLTHILGLAPGTDPYREADAVSNTYPSYPQKRGNGKQKVPTLTNAQTEGQQGACVTLHGGISYVQTDFTALGVSASLQFRLKLQEVKPGQILFEADAPYGAHDIRITAAGKLGFTRESYAYEFDYAPPVGEAVLLEIRTQPLCTALIVKGTEIKATGEFLHNGVAKKQGITNASFLLPLARVGSATNAVCGTIDQIKITPLARQAKKKKWIFWK